MLGVVQFLGAGMRISAAFSKGPAIVGLLRRKDSLCFDCGVVPQVLACKKS